MRWGIKSALLVVVLVMVLPGSAAGFGPVASFGEFGSGPGQLRAPAQLTLDAAGDLYVVDSGNDRIEVFGGDGAFLRSFGVGVVDEPRDVALVSGKGYVADYGNDRIDVFSSEGGLLFSFGGTTLAQPGGIATDGLSVFVADLGNKRIDVFGSGGEFLYSFSGSLVSPEAAAVGADGNLYVADSGAKRIFVFTKLGVLLRSFGSEGSGALSDPVALSAESSGQVLVADRADQRIERFSQSGTWLSGFAAEPAVSGVAVGCEGNVLTSEQATSLARIQRFAEPGTPPPPCTPPSEEAEIVTTALPSNRFHFAGLVRNRSNGYAVLYVRVPGPGILRLEGHGFRRLHRTARQATTVQLPIKPKVRLRYFLKRHGKGRIRVEVTFIPAGGTPRTQEKVILLRRRRG